MLSIGNLFKKKQAVKELEDYNKHVIQVGNEFISSSSMLLNKQVSGEFYCLEELIVDDTAYITGNITTVRCVIKGRIHGDVLCLKNIIIKNTAIIDGEITAGTVEVESGAVINGCITLQRGLQAPHLIQKVKEAEGAYGSFKVPAIKPTELPRKEEEKKEPALQQNISPAKDIPTESQEKPITESIKKNIPNTNDGKWW